MKRTATFILLLLSAAAAIAGQTDKRIDAIRTVARETDRMITECEADGETSTTFLAELVVNKNNGSYPAVGIYRSTAKFYYTFGDREKNPYPDRLLKIVVETKRSARVELAEYLFDGRGRLIFYFGREDDVDRRIYFDDGKMFRALEGEKVISGNDAKTVADRALAESRRLTAMFRESLKF